MAVRVGSARHDENGKITGGKAGDQTGDEVCRQPWYKHSKGWVCIRAKSADMREKIARCMEYACDNNNIGYDQSQNTTLREVAKKYGYDCSKVTEKCETDCAKLVQVCIRYADFPACPSFYTGSEVEVLKATGKFDILTADKYTTSSKYLLRGDILVTKVKGHTVVVLDNGSGVKSDTENAPSGITADHVSVKIGDKGGGVKELQRALNELGYTDTANQALDVDGSFGPKTEQALKKLQKANALLADGMAGPVTWAKIDELLKSQTTSRVGEVITPLYMRTGPGTSYNTKGVLSEGQRVSITIRSNNWGYVTEYDGWISLKYVKF